ncbi:MAG: Peptidase associated domain protein [Moraxellaceae bacterium]|nr:Peptidase associated domain protein [Moraxellaceae bacterium]
MTELSLPPAHPAFEAIRAVPIPSLNLTVAEYRHKKTGAIHYHLAADNPENVFCVALRTMPMDSTGVAHILEHTALCGSRKYPVRDPFFMMIRRSLNSFMNAMTSSDWTAYPFASPNRKDFDNLLSVYLDAVFFARIDPLDFMQEGIRVEFEEPDNPESPLVYKGVVFNEMKGAMSSVSSVLWEALNEHLFPTTTYHYNSGGDPAVIPDLTYEQLVAFYKEHYHPSNAVFMTYGDIPAVELQEKIEAQALKEFTALPEQIRGHDEKRYGAPVAVELPYALDEEDTTAKTHVVLGWLLGHTANLKERFDMELLSGVLLENSASPLRHFLETTELGAAPSSLLGVDDSGREMTFLCGIEGSEHEHAQAFEEAVLAVLKKVAEEGVPLEDVEAVLHQLELSQREIGGDSYPYGLQLIMNGLGAVLHDGDPVSLWDMDAALAELRHNIRNPHYIRDLVQRWLLDNPHRVRVTLVPDTLLSEKRREQEAARLEQIRAALTPEAAEKIRVEAAALQARQLKKDDPEILPRVGREDIPAELRITQGTTTTLRQGGRDVPLAVYTQGTNGLVYEQLILDLPPLVTEELELLPLYTALVSELGAGHRDYLAMQQWQSRVSGGLRMSYSVRGDLADPQAGLGHLVFSGKALNNQADAFNVLMRTTLEDLRFDERARVREFVAQMKARWEHSVTGQGHSLAMQAASAPFSAVAGFSQRIAGLQGIRRIKALDAALAKDESLDALLARLQGLHSKVLAAPRRFLLIAEGEHVGDLEHKLATAWETCRYEPLAEPFRFLAPPPAESVAWLANTQVQFCSKAYATVPLDHPDAAPLMLLGGFLRNGFLHGAIRERGGAYGGGAGYDSNACAFRFYSYRDPRLEGTLADFDASVRWLLEEKHEQRQLEEAVLGIISDMDKPLSPAGEARVAYHNALYGRTPEQRRRTRARILSTTLDDLRRVGELYLTQDAVTAVVLPAAKAGAAEALGLRLEKL